MFDTQPYEDKMAQTFSHFQDELKKVRTGRAHVGMLDGVMRSEEHTSELQSR